MDYLVPDSIEPIKAWRSWHVSPSGHLISCTNSTIWPAREPLKAECNQYPPVREELEWELQLGRDDMSDADAWNVVLGTPIHKVDWSFPKQNNMFGTHIFIAHETYFPFGMNIPARPSQKSIDGYGWVLVKKIYKEAMTHEAPEPLCSCGIYMKKSASMDYLNGFPTEAFGEIAGWGRVINGDKGARVEFAYPQKIYLRINPNAFTIETLRLVSRKEQTFELAMKLQKNYGVPVIYDQKRVTETLEQTFIKNKDFKSMVIAGMPDAVITRARRKTAFSNTQQYIFLSLVLVNLLLFVFTRNIFNGLVALILGVGLAFIAYYTRK